MKLKIVSDIPIPAKEKRGPSIPEQMAEMKVGDSFFTTSAVNTVRVQASAAKIRIRCVSTSNGRRVWRVA